MITERERKRGRKEYGENYKKVSNFEKIEFHLINRMSMNVW